MGFNLIENFARQKHQHYSQYDIIKLLINWLGYFSDFYVSKHAEIVTQATVMLLKPYMDKVLTITTDNGKEFAGHESITQQLNAALYFAPTYSSWERELNENTNGLIRQYFKKGSSFENITESQVKDVMQKLNHRPQKTLNYKTPHAVFFGDDIRQAA